MDRPKRRTGRITGRRTQFARRPLTSTAEAVRRRRNRMTRNRLEGAQNRFRNNQRGTLGRFRRADNFRRRRNLAYRILFIGNLPQSVDNRRLYSLFKNEGRIIGVKIIYNRMGLSNGYGFVEFDNPNDAFRSIKKWNNTTYGGNTIRVEYRKPRRGNRNFGGNRFNGGSRNYDRPRNGFNGGRGRFMGGYRPRGRY